MNTIFDTTTNYALFTNTDNYKYVKSFILKNINEKKLSASEKNLWKLFFKEVFKILYENKGGWFYIKNNEDIQEKFGFDRNETINPFTEYPKMNYILYNTDNLLRNKKLKNI